MAANGPPARPRIFSRQAMEDPEILPVDGGQVAVFSCPSPHKASDNEDAAAVIPLDGGRSVLAVADGLGGHAYGAEASGLTLELLAKRTAAALDGEGGTLRAALVDGIDQANERVMALGSGAATTLVAAEIDGVAVRPYHVGDSMVLVVGQRGRIKLQTVSHSPVGYAVEAGLLDESEAIHHVDRHLVSNIVGSPEMRIEVGGCVQLAARDTMVLASDGLFDNLHVGEVVELVRAGPLAAAAKALAAAGIRRMREPEEGHPSKPDDLTFLIYRRRT